MLNRLDIRTSVILPEATAYAYQSAWSVVDRRKYFTYAYDIKFDRFSSLIAQFSQLRCIEYCNNILLDIIFAIL